MYISFNSIRLCVAKILLPNKSYYLYVVLACDILINIVIVIASISFILSR